MLFTPLSSPLACAGKILIKNICAQLLPLQGQKSDDYDEDQHKDVLTNHCLIQTVPYIICYHANNWIIGCCDNHCVNIYW